MSPNVDNEWGGRTARKLTIQMPRENPSNPIQHRKLNRRRARTWSLAHTPLPTIQLVLAVPPWSPGANRTISLAGRNPRDPTGRDRAKNGHRQLQPCLNKTTDIPHDPAVARALRPVSGSAQHRH